MRVDGCAQNMLLLDAIVRDARRGKRLSLVGIDLSKAFATVSIHSIRRALRRHQIEEGIIEYIRHHT